MAELEWMGAMPLHVIIPTREVVQTQPCKEMASLSRHILPPSPCKEGKPVLAKRTSPAEANGAPVFSCANFDFVGRFQYLRDRDYVKH